MKKHSFILTVFCFFILQFSAQPVLTWAGNVWNKTSGLEPYRAVTDNNGNMYFTGEFRDSMDFDPGPGTFIQSPLITPYSAFLAKYDNNGSLVWMKQFGMATGLAVGIIATGEIIISGTFGDTIDADPGPAITTLNWNGVNDVFISKFDTSGNLIWSESFGGSSFDGALTICPDDLGNFYLGGYFSDTVDFDPSAGTAIVMSTGNFDAYFARFNSAGQLSWVKTFGGTSVSNEIISRLNYNVNGALYGSGTFKSTVDFDPGPSSFSLTSAGGDDLFFAAYDSAGNFSWAKRVGSSGDERLVGSGLSADGDYYITGAFKGTVDFNPGAGSAFLSATALTPDAFVAKYSSNGTYIWAKKISGPGDEATGNFCLDSLENIFVTGYFSNTTDVDPGSGVVNLIPVGGYDSFFAKYDSLGNYLWAYQFGGTGSDNATNIFLLSDGSMQVIGEFQNSLDVDFTVSNHTLLQEGVYIDLFFVRYSPWFLGMNDLMLKPNDFSLFPVPAKENVKLKTEFSPYKIINLSIKDIRGENLLTIKISSEETSLPLENFPSGIYFVTLTDEKGNAVTKKLVISK